LDHLGTQEIPSHKEFIRSPTGMPSVTNVVSAGSGWRTTYSLGWEEKRINLQAKRIIGRYGICR
jgi:hypothetical protein